MNNIRRELYSAPGCHCESCYLGYIGLCAERVNLLQLLHFLYLLPELHFANYYSTKMNNIRRELDSALGFHCENYIRPPGAIESVVTWEYIRVCAERVNLLQLLHLLCLSPELHYANYQRTKNEQYQARTRFGPRVPLRVLLLGNISVSVLRE
ncbi:hypothetical protein J6590_103739 [Homalodisca vitripennis]|nr:hypothetical protein J6590_103739 [Homalodisca vitripennis]